MTTEGMRGNEQGHSGAHRNLPNLDQCYANVGVQHVIDHHGAFSSSAIFSIVSEKSSLNLLAPQDDRF